MNWKWFDMFTFLFVVLASYTVAATAYSQPVGEVGVMREATRRHNHQPLTQDDTIGDLLRHPAFAGFAHRLLPWDGRAYDEAMRLRDIDALLPYHSHVEPRVVVGALNRMIDEVNNGETIFHDFYTEVEKRADPSKANTGLVFLRGKPGAPFAVVSPGGGFAYVGAVHEGFPYAIDISEKGHNAFVLRYRAGYGGAAATEDLAKAVSWIFRNAAALRVDTAGYSLWGSSAGARMAAAIGSHGVAAFGGGEHPKPAVVVMAYTGHTDRSDDEPATFVVVGGNDQIASPSVMRGRAAALRDQGTDVEFHEYKGLGHGFGTGAGTSADGWIAAAIAFWEKSIRR